MKKSLNTDLEGLIIQSGKTLFDVQSYTNERLKKGLKEAKAKLDKAIEYDVRKKIESLMYSEIIADVAQALLLESDINQCKRHLNNFTDLSAPLHFAAYHNNKSLALFLIENGADVNVKSSEMARTPLHIASANKEMYEFLVSQGANEYAKDENGWTPKQWLNHSPDKFLLGCTILMGMAILGFLNFMCCLAINSKNAYKNRACKEEAILSLGLIFTSLFACHRFNATYEVNKGEIETPKVVKKVKPLVS